MSQPFRRNNQSSGAAFQKKKEQQKKESGRQETMTIQTAEGNKVVTVNSRRGNDVGQSARFQDRMYAMQRQPNFIPPDTDRTQIIQKRNQRPVFVEGVTPLPPPITPAQREAMRIVQADTRQSRADFRMPTKEDVLSLNRQGGGGSGMGGDPITGGSQFIEGAPSVATTRRLVRKFVSSLGKGGTNTGSNFTFTLDETIRNVIKIRFVSISMIYVVPINQPLTGFIFLEDFPKENPFYYESAEGTYQPKTLNRYQAVFPILTGTVAASVRFQYTFPEYYQINLLNATSTISELHVSILKEDLVVIPGQMIDFNDITSCNIELELTVEKKSVS